MNRVDAELDLLTNWYGDSLDFVPEGQWVRLRDYHVPASLWQPSVVEVAFQIPPDAAANPYSFCARPSNGLVPALKSASGSGAISNYAFPASTPWGGAWGRFSWQLAEWKPCEPIGAGSTVLDFARSISARFREGP